MINLLDGLSVSFVCITTYPLATAPNKQSRAASLSQLPPPRLIRVELLAAARVVASRL